MDYTRYKTLEFANDIEANEYIRDNNLEVSDIEYGEFGVMVHVINNEIPLNYYEEPENLRFVIFSPLGAGKKLYVYDRGLPNRYGYEQMLAKVFDSEAQAHKVASIMCNSGTRHWLVEKLVSRY